MARRNVQCRPAKAHDLREAFQTLVRRFGLLEAERTPCGQPLPISQAHALMELLRVSKISQGELAALLGLSKSGTSRMVAALEQRGWIERRSSSTDGRVRQLSLTVRGERLAQKIDHASITRFSEMLERIPRADRPQALATLHLIGSVVPARQSNGSKG